MAQDANERWWYIDNIFSEAIDLPPEEREAFLDEACQGDPGTRCAVEDLLASFDASEGLFDDPTNWFPNNLEALAEMAALADIPFMPGMDNEAPEAEQIAPLTGERIGAYRLLTEIGRGGMGAVYLAERADGQYRQRVALKLIRHSKRTDETVRRFLLEREILARLQHPNIARLLDGGLTDDGLLYFVMEYVKGVAIDTYCEQNDLDLKERLTLFFAVCEAVQYAHQNLVIHRDLKPSNVLVTERGQVKLLDFGIAKLLDEENRPEDAPHTRPGMRLMTPEYASPEQARNEPVTTTSDVYALGLILYKLLTGHRAFNMAGKSVSEIEDIICQVYPKRPSWAVGRNGEDTSDTETTIPESTTRTSHTERLRRQLSGDLDVIVMKALRKEPTRRYTTVAELVDDLRRHLRGMPVQARPATMRYLAGRFIRRHRAGVAAACLMGLLLFAYAGTVTLKNQEIQRTLDQKEQLTEVLTDIFAASDPDNAEGRDITARELLDAWDIARIERRFPDQPLLQADLMYVIGETYKGLGVYEKSQEFLNAALERRRPNQRAPHPDLAATLDELGTVYRYQGNYEQAQTLLQEAIAMWRALPGQALGQAESLSNLGVVLWKTDDLDAAEQHLNEALALQRRAVQGDHVDIAETLNNLALIEEQRGNYTAGEARFTEVYAMQRRLLGERHTSTTLTLHNLGTQIMRQGRYEEADSLLEKTLHTRRTLLGEDHPRLIMTLNHLGQIKLRLGQFNKAEALFEQSHAIAIKRLGLDHPDLAITYAYLGYVNHQQGEYAQAVSFYRQGLVINEATYGNTHWRVAYDRALLARLETERGNFDEAQDLFEQAIHSLRSTQNAPQYLARTLLWFGRMRMDQEQPAAAYPLFAEALELRQQFFDEGHWRIAETEVALGWCLSRLDQFDEAQTLLVSGYETLRLQDERGEPYQRTQEALAYLIALYESWNRPEQAETYRNMLQ